MPSQFGAASAPGIGAQAGCLVGAEGARSVQQCMCPAGGATMECPDEPSMQSIVTVEIHHYPRVVTAP